MLDLARVLRVSRRRVVGAKVTVAEDAVVDVSEAVGAGTHALTDVAGGGGHLDVSEEVEGELELEPEMESAKGSNEEVVEVSSR
jgi:hypothetical protein